MGCHPWLGFNTLLIKIAFNQSAEGTNVFTNFSPSNEPSKSHQQIKSLFLNLNQNPSQNGQHLLQTIRSRNFCREIPKININTRNQTGSLCNHIPTGKGCRL